MRCSLHSTYRGMLKMQHHQTCCSVHYPDNVVITNTCFDWMHHTYMHLSSNKQCCKIFGSCEFGSRLD